MHDNIPVHRGATAEEATTDILERQLPMLSGLMQTADLHVDSIDVFCERGVFNVEQTRRILTAGHALGLAANFHAEELHLLRSAEVSHPLMHASDRQLTVATWHPIISTAYPRGSHQHSSLVSVNYTIVVSDVSDELTNSFR